MNQEIKRFNSLKLRLLLSITLVMTVTVALSFAFFFYKTFESEYAKLKIVGARTAQLTAAASGSLLWNVDTATLKQLLEAQTIDNTMEYIHVYDHNNNLVAQKVHGNQKGTAPVVTSGKGLVFDVPVTFRDEKIGHVQVAMTSAGIVQGLKERVLFALGVFLSVLILTTVVVYFELYRMVLNPLNKILAAIQRMAQGDFDIHVHVAQQNELGLVAQSFNRMSQDLKKMYDLLESKQLMAESANKAKSQFLANMSHELRTPLNAIIGYSDILMEEAMEDHQEANYQDLKRINQAGLHLLSLVNDILDISKIESGKMEIFLEDFDVRDLAQEITNLAEPLMTKNGNVFKVEFGPGSTNMHSDFTKVKQIITNLISNASKFTEKGEVRLIITPNFKGEHLIQFSVQDSGIGMTPEQLAKIFHNFTQADESTSRKYGGTGLGLAISKNFTEMLGGSVSVESEAGKGTTFRVTLPMVSSKEKDVKKTA